MSINNRLVYILVVHAYDIANIIGELSDHSIYKAFKKQR